MAENEGAGTGDGSGQGGSGAPSGGSPEGGSENDDKPITARQLKAALASQKRAFEDQIAAKDRELAAFKEGVGQRQVEKPKVYSKPELKAAVDAGQISQEQADELWDRQRETQIREAARTEALEAVTAKSTQERIDGDIAKYKALKPEIVENGSEVRERIREEYKYLVSAGSPNNVATELAAIRAVLGPLEKLEKAATARRSEDHEQQGGGSGDGNRGGNKAGKTLAEKLDPRWKEHYEKGIKQGRYKDWSEVEKELKYATPARRQSMGIPG